jgi:hypothetical protein
VTFVIVTRFRCREPVGKPIYHAIVDAAREVGCFASFVPSGASDDIRLQLIAIFDRLDLERDVVFSISTSPFDQMSSDLFDDVMLDAEGYSSDENVPRLASLVAEFIGRIPFCGEFLLVMSDGFGIREDFRYLDVEAGSLAESIISMFLGEVDHQPSIALRGELPVWRGTEQGATGLPGGAPASFILVARNFLCVLAAPVVPADRLCSLAVALDRLALAYHECPEGKLAEREAARPDRGDREEIRLSVTAAFPDFGFYDTGDPAKDLSQGVSPDAIVGDAVNDLADITQDLREVLWRWEHVGPDDAAWHFRFSYETHWGRHLHDLRSYVYARQFDR